MYSPSSPQPSYDNGLPYPYNDSRKIDVYYDATTPSLIILSPVTWPILLYFAGVLGIVLLLYLLKWLKRRKCIDTPTANDLYDITASLPIYFNRPSSIPTRTLDTAVGHI
jgi:hypothetical protein